MKRGLRAQVLDLFATDPAPNVAQPPLTPAQALAPPAPPVAKRLNRNALTVAAVIMGMTVIACLVVLRGDSRAGTTRAAVDPALTNGTNPTFLDRPAQSPGTLTPSTLNAPTQAARASAAAGRVPSRALAQRGSSDALSSSLDAISSPGPATPGPSATAPRPREQAFNAALKRSAIAHDDRTATPGEGEATSASPTSSSVASDEARLIAYGDSIMRTATHGAAAPASSTVSVVGPGRAFMQQAGDLAGRSSVARLEPLGSPYTLRAGTVIPAILLTAITSDLPGDCMGQVARDVYDSQTQRTVLIPKGSKLMCRYDDQVAAGQGRLLVAWTRLMLPDGRSMTLPGLALKDAQGQTGAKGDVDNHTPRVFGRALLLSAIGAGAQLSQPRQVTILAAPGTGQVMAGAVGQELSNVALEVLRRGMDQPPTITVPQGQTFNVFLNGDLVFDGPYDASR